MDEKTLARFWSKVDRNGPVPAHAPHLGPCWLWTATRTPPGYGQLGIKLNGKHRMAFAHRVSFFIHNGRWPEPICCHHCDNPSCVNPAHLFAGTQSDNLADMDAKGRRNQPRGERIGLSKLTEFDVQAIRAAAANGQMLKDIAPAYGVSRKTISVIVSRKHWKHA